MTTFDVLNFAVSISSFTLFIYTVTILRRAITKCTSFQFENHNTYLICFIFIFILTLQFSYLLGYLYMANLIIYITLLHFLGDLTIKASIFITLCNSGHGLVLIPH